MKRRTLGGGEWVGVGYMTLVIGTLIGGFAGATRWYEIALAFAAALVLTLVIGRVLAAVDPGRHAPRD